ncbi:hypothetical protein BD410DRAFT_483182 [Rickenella mellea]|uniref:Uncharacterized protein n=1 Tax=Rickenella mellea TaxID=50990 RepID=A0A4Y7QHB8_9AGAM|nr:hypothetical protein BD410DRAFT_483182 [Rickenella mellea]
MAFLLRTPSIRLTSISLSLSCFTSDLRLLLTAVLSHLLSCLPPHIFSSVFHTADITLIRLLVRFLSPSNARYRSRAPSAHPADSLPFCTPHNISFSFYLILYIHREGLRVPSPPVYIRPASTAGFLMYPYTFFFSRVHGLAFSYVHASSLLVASSRRCMYLQN